MMCQKKSIFLFCFLILGAILSGHSQAQVPENPNGTDTAGQGKKYRWPLDIDNGFSASFQEFRSGHFHAGLDLRTFKKNGYPVYAIADGVVRKIRMAKRGTGRSVFFKQDDGYSSIFFHLDHFSEELEEIVERVQREKGKKYFGYYRLEKPIRFSKGQLIAYAGETGAGFPHLHLEIRDKNGVAVNPFKILEFPSPDTNSPVLNAIILRSRNNASLNGSIGERYLKFQKVDDVFTVIEPLVMTGSFDIVLNTFDIADTGKGVGIYEITALIDDRVYYRLSFDEFKKDDNNQLGFVYDLGYSGAGSYFYNVFYQEGFSLEQKHMWMDEVYEGLDYGKHVLKLLVKDNDGNVSTGIVPFHKVREPEIEVSGIALQRMPGMSEFSIRMNIDRLKINPMDQAGQVLVVVHDTTDEVIFSGEIHLQDISETKEFIINGVPEGAAYMDFSFYTENVLYANYRYAVEKDYLSDLTDIPVDYYIYRDTVFVKIKDKQISARDIGLNVVLEGKRVPVAPKTGSDGVYFCFKPVNANPLNPVLLHFSIFKDRELIAEIEKRMNLLYLRNGVKQTFSDGEFEAEFAGNSVYEPKVLVLEEKNYKSWLPLLSRAVGFSPSHFPFLDTVFIKFKKSLPRPKQVGIYRYNANTGGWRYSGTVYDPKTSTYRIRVITPGTYALIRDTSAPSIKFLGAGSKRLQNVEQLVFRISDGGKGLNDSSILVWVNQKRACKNFDWDYDPDYSAYTVRDIHLLRKGKNVVRVKVWDNAGNSTVRVFRFKLK